MLTAGVSTLEVGIASNFRGSSAVGGSFKLSSGFFSADSGWAISLVVSAPENFLTLMVRMLMTRWIPQADSRSSTCDLARSLLMRISALLVAPLSRDTECLGLLRGEIQVESSWLASDA